MTLVDHQPIQDELQRHLKGTRTESAALLAWFLEAVWRVEPEDIDEAICDGTGDKGIDGLLVNDDLAEITVLQSKHKVNHDGGQGDKDLRDLVGAAAYFVSADSIDGLLASNPNQELKLLLARLDVRNKVAAGAHATRLIFVTDGILNDHGQGYVDAIKGHEPPLEVWDQPRLAAVARRTQLPELLDHKIQLEAVSEPMVIERDGKVELAVGVVPAAQIVKLPGIEDLSLFDRNVRLSKGRTGINRDLGITIDDASEHALFPAYHNGLTMLTYDLAVVGAEMKLDGITVVNGCQSILTLYEHQEHVTGELGMLVKVVRVDKQSGISDKITYRSNNQNPVDIRDQRSTDVVQRDLQAQVRSEYGDRIFYAIREGEQPTAPTVLDNKTAAQFLMAAYLVEPWNAVRKVRLFDNDYRRIFDHTINAHKLYLMQILVAIVDEQRSSLLGELSASFSSIRFTLAFLIAQLLRQSDKGRLLLEFPERWLPDLTDEVSAAIVPLAQDAGKSVNFYVEQERKDRTERGEDFDPKTAFKSRAGVSDIENQVLRLAERLAMQAPPYWFEVDPVR